MSSHDDDGLRTGAYAVIRSPDERVLLIEANGGRLYLPGGRIEAGETPEEALLREILEECGCASAVIAEIGESDQPVHGGLYSIRAHYFEARLTRTVCAGEHPSRWMPAEQAIAAVHRRGDGWAINQALLRGSAAPKAYFAR